MPPKILIAGAAGAVAVVGVAALLLLRTPAEDGSKMLVGEKLGDVRREALAILPRGMAIADANNRLQQLGFRCAPVRRLLPNVTAPSVQCDSAGRGFPSTARLIITVMARNSTVTDVAVGHGMDAVQADARTPDPDDPLTPLVAVAAAGAKPETHSSHVE